jgi:hypothetical protein
MLERDDDDLLPVSRLCFFEEREKIFFPNRMLSGRSPFLDGILLAFDL